MLRNEKDPKLILKRGGLKESQTISFLKAHFQLDYRNLTTIIALILAILKPK
jgi:hypothetical protein